MFAGILVAALLSFAIAMQASSPVALSAPAREALDQEIAAIVSDPAYPLAGVAAIALRGGEVAYEGYVGRMRIDAANPANDRAVNADTLYRVASMSKLVVTLGVLRLVDEGRLDLDRDVSGYLGWRLRNPHFPDAPITLRMMLSHMSSLRDDGGYFWDRAHRLRDVLQPGGPHHGAGAMWAKNAPPGAFFTYANLPWGVVGEAMEAVTGERFDRLMKRLVLDPLGVPGGFSPADLSPEDLANLATLYRKRENLPDGREIWRAVDGPWYAQVDDYSREAPAPRAGPDYVPGSNGTLYAPQGGLRTSAQGLARVMRVLMDRGLVDGKPFLRPETVDEMLAEQWQHAPRRRNGDAASEEGHPGLFNAWGLGNQHFLDLSGPGRGDRLVEGGGFKAVGHLGDAWGLTGTFAFNPESHDGLIVLVGGVGADPSRQPGLYSAHYRHDERLLSALWRGAVQRARQE